MSTQTTSRKNNAESGRSDLDRRYGRIGIAAVAAAMPYHSQAKKPAAPATAKPRASAEDDAE